MRPRKDAGDFDMMTPPVEHLKHYTAPVRSYARMADILAMGDDEMARARTGLASDRRSSAVQILPGEVVVEMPSKEAFEESLGDDWNWGMDVTTKNEHARSSKRVRDDTGLHTGTSSTSSQDENGVESIGSTLNRQASLLLLLYPRRLLSAIFHLDCTLGGGSCGSGGVGSKCPRLATPTLALAHLCTGRHRRHHLPVHRAPVPTAHEASPS